MERIEKLEMLIPKLKNNNKINPLKIESMEWELRALKAEQQLKILNMPVVVGQSEQLCPKCSSNDLFDIDDHYIKCQDCGFTFVGA